MLQRTVLILLSVSIQSYESMIDEVIIYPKIKQAPSDKKKLESKTHMQ